MSVTKLAADGTQKPMPGKAQFQIRGFLFAGKVKLRHLKTLLHLPERPEPDTVRLTFPDEERYDVKFTSEAEAVQFEAQCERFFTEHQTKIALDPVAIFKKEGKTVHGVVEKTDSPQKRLSRFSHDDDFAFTNQDNISGDNKRPRRGEDIGMTPPLSGAPHWQQNVTVMNTPEKGYQPIKVRPMQRAPARGTSSLITAGLRQYSAAQSSSAYRGYRSTVSFGLRNLGNTCYLNAVLQAIASMRMFVTDLTNMAKGLPAVGSGELYTHSVEILNRMGTAVTSGPLNPAKLRERIGRVSPMFASGGQQDAHEFLLEYINQLHDEMLEARKTAPTVCDEATSCEDVVPLATQVHFDSEVEKNLSCMECKHTRVVREPFRDFSLDFGPATRSSGDRCNLDSMLKSYFNGELLEAKCEHCGTPEAWMQKRMTTRPNALILHLKRFVPNWEKQRYDKQHQFVDIPTTLDLQSCLSESASADSTSSARLPARPLASEDARTDGAADGSTPSHTTAQGEQAYVLRAIVAHDGGSPQSGHYVCYTRADSGTWRLYDDSSVRECGNGTYQSELGRKAYIVFYVLGNHAERGAEGNASTTAS